MKRAIITVILFALTQLSLAQEDTNVREIVRKEFENAKGIRLENQDNSLASSTVLIKLLIILTASAGSFGWVYWRRKKLKVKNGSLKLKENIKTLRTEKIKYEMDPALKIVRKNLLATVPGTALQNDTINSSAKRLKIAREEIAIAARLKIYSQNPAGGSIA